MSLFRAIFGFGLPGFAAGWLFAGSILQFSGDPVGAGAVFAAFALGGALAGRWLIRNQALLGIGLLLLIAAAGLPILNRGFFPLAAFAFGVLAVRPVHRRNRRSFQTGVLLAVITAFFAGGNRLLNPIVCQSIMFTLLPAAVMMMMQALSEHKAVSALLTIAAGLTIAFLIPWQADVSAVQVANSGTVTRCLQENNILAVQTPAGEYKFPRDLSRHTPDLLPAALQPQAEQLRVLVVEEVPSTAAEQLCRFPWIFQADILQFSRIFPDKDIGRTLWFGDVPSVRKHLQENPHLQYDLVLFLDIPSGSPEAGKKLLRTAEKDFLNEQGVLIFPGQMQNGAAAWLPGSRRHFQMRAKCGARLAETFEELENRLQIRSSISSGILPAGILQSLYELRGPEAVTEKLHPPPGYRFFLSVRKTAQSFRFFTYLLAGIMIFTVFWLSRYPVYGDNFAIFTRGAGIMLALTNLLIAAADFQLLLPFPVPAAFGLIALAIPHRQKHVRSLIILAVLLLAAAGTGLYFLPFNRAWLTPGLLFLLVPVCWLGAGNCGTDSARYLHFLGLIFGLILFSLLPPWAALPAALLLLWF